MYIKFETAKLAKEKGFNVPTWECFNSKGKPIDYSRNIYAYENDGKFISRPTQSDLQKWLREEHKIFTYAFDDADSKRFYWGVSVLFSGETTEDTSEDPLNDSFEEAIEESLVAGLELIDE